MQKDTGGGEEEKQLLQEVVLESKQIPKLFQM